MKRRQRHPLRAAARSLCAVLGLLGMAAAAQAQDLPAPRNTRHALIIGIGEYAAPGVPPLKGVVHDMDSARRIAQAMAVPTQNIRLLRDREATADRIRDEIDALDARVHDGDRVFVYYSGHGTRWQERADAPTCVEGLYAADGQVLSNAEIGQRLAAISHRADKMLVFYDACFSGGVAGAPFRTRALRPGAELLTPKFTPVGAPEACAQPSNFRTRNLALVMEQRQAPPGNVVHIAAARPDEVSFDHASQGGFATSAWRDCLLGGAQDLDHSGGVTVEEVTRCAQDKVTAGLARYPDILGQRLTLAGNTAFVPAWMSAAFAPAAAAAQVAAVATLPSLPLVAGPDTTAAPPPPAQPPRLTPAQMLAELHRQRDAGRDLRLALRTPSPRVDVDTISFDVTSPRDGYMYIALAGSDGASLYLLFPNALASDNRVRAGQTLRLPGVGWEIVAGPPAGTETVLAMVTDAPRDLTRLQAERGGPYLKALLDDAGRARLQELLTSGLPAPVCETQAGGTPCSEAFGAALVTVTTSP